MTPEDPRRLIGRLARHLPGDLLAERRFLPWVARPRRGGGTAKVPLRWTGADWVAVDAGAAAHWLDFEVAAAALRAGGPSGLAFALTGAGVVALDLDDCFDWRPGRARFRPAARQVAGALLAPGCGYVELSPGGHGAHILVRGAVPPGGRRTAGVEWLDRGIVTLTGRVPRGRAQSLDSPAGALARLHAACFPPYLGPGGAARPRPAQLDETRLLGRARAAHNGAKFSRLYDFGDVAGYASRSEAVAALVAMLVFWSGGDAGVTDRLFRRSALFDTGWDRPATAAATGRC